MVLTIGDVCESFLLQWLSDYAPQMSKVQETLREAQKLRNAKIAEEEAKAQAATNAGAPPHPEPMHVDDGKVVEPDPTELSDLWDQIQKLAKSKNEEDREVGKTKLREFILEQSKRRKLG